jgi:hypothetical protein
MQTRPLFENLSDYWLSALNRLKLNLNRGCDATSLDSCSGTLVLVSRVPDLI